MYRQGISVFADQHRELKQLWFVALNTKELKLFLQHFLRNDGVREEGMLGEYENYMSERPKQILTHQLFDICLTTDL